MDTSLFDQLLYESESTTLDFKRDQYRFSKASDDEKSELLKDILGFANAWRRSDAYILIGVEEVQGGRSVVHGISEQLQDHALQQFVNNITNRPVQFGYEACEFEGKPIGVIRIEQQHRPIYLKKDYGKLQKEKVYIRRGSSTDPQRPAGIDEIALMGRETFSEAQTASLTIEFADTAREISLGDRIKWDAELCQMPETKEIPRQREQTYRGPGHPLLGDFQVPQLSGFDVHDRLNWKYFHELAEYEFVKRLFRKVRLVVTNTGEVSASDVRIEISIAAAQGVVILKSSKFPQVPKRRRDEFYMAAMRDIEFRHAVQPAGSVTIESNEHEFKIEIECGTLQPGRRIWSDDFYIGIGRSGETELSANLLAGNLPGPRQCTLVVETNIVQTQMTVNDLLSLPDPVDKEQ